jgi:5-methylcytosine-specific restriction endonuclease McrA
LHLTSKSPLYEAKYRVSEGGEAVSNVIAAPVGAKVPGIEENLRVSLLKLPLQTRIAVWQAYSRKCAYCGDPIPLGDLDIDHVLPESLNDNRDELERVKSELGLLPDFSVNSLANLVPAHRRCNLAKSDRVFHPARVRYFLEIAAAKEPVVCRYIESLAFQDRKERLLASIRAAFETGIIISRRASTRLQRTDIWMPPCGTMTTVKPG